MPVKMSVSESSGTDSESKTFAHNVSIAADDSDSDRLGHEQGDVLGGPAGGVGDRAGADEREDAASARA